MSTTSPSPDARPGTARVVKLWWVTGPILAVLLGAVIWVAARPVAYYTLSPGSSHSVEPLLTITSTRDDVELTQDKVRDDLYFLTVSLRQPFGLEVLVELTDHQVDVVQQSIIDGTLTRDQNRKFNRSLMTNAKDKSAKVALERAGYEVEVSTTGAVIADIGPTYPVAKVLLPGDTIVEADGDKITRAEDMVEVIARYEPGDKIDVVVETLDGGSSRSVEIELASHPEDATKAMMGVSLESRPSYKFPFDVEIDSGTVGGSSAGLAFALAILDRITPGALTGGIKVAITGTMELDGRVGPIGGIEQKTYAAIDTGADLFLVPDQEYEEAVAIGGDKIEVRAVGTFEEALDVLAAMGGDPVPKALAVPASSTPGT